MRIGTVMTQKPYAYSIRYVVTCMACSADKERVLAVCLEEILQSRLDLILQMACI